MEQKEFDSYWQSVMDELDAMPIATEEEFLAIRSTDLSSTYAIRYTSIGPYRLFSYLTVPHTNGPFPALLYLPGYQTVLSPLQQGDSIEKRRRYMILCASVRGQRNSDQPYCGEIPGWFTDGIDDPARWVFRGIVADCCRAVDFLLTRKEVNPARIALIGGNELSLITAALRPQISYVISSPSLFYRPREHPSPGGSFHNEEINDFVRRYPKKEKDIERTLSLFDPVRFAPSVKARCLLGGDEGFLAPLTEKIGGPFDLRPRESSSFLAGVFQERWLASQLGIGELLVPEVWRG